MVLSNAKQWQQAGTGGLFGEAERELANAAIAVLEAQPEVAKAAIIKARSKFGETWDQGWLQFTAWQLERLERRITCPIALRAT
jgi:hypothetical protein